jgi:hypothetical protein
MEEELDLISIIFLMLILPVTLNAIVLWELTHSKDKRSAVGYFGLAGNFVAMAILSGTFIYNRFWHGMIDGNLSAKISLGLAFSSVILGIMAPKGVARRLIVFTGLYLTVLWVLFAGSAGV